MRQNASPEQAALDQARHDLDEEHQELRRIVGRVREARDPATLAATLDELHPRLKAHFAHEEFPNGLYHSMGALARDHAAEVRELVDEHFQLLSAVRGLADEARRHQGGGPESLLKHAGVIADRLRAHEEKELHLADTLQHR